MSASITNCTQLVLTLNASDWPWDECYLELKLKREICFAGEGFAEGGIFRL